MPKKVDSPGSNVEMHIKIQQAYPVHLSKLPHKEVGYLVHVEMEKTYKMSHCVESEHNNSEMYKRFSKSFQSNLAMGRDQMLLCCGIEEETRMQTSVGSKKNPGIFMIAGIGILDEKYQVDHINYDVEIGFMEYREGRLYDLLTNTGEPLKMTRSEDKNALHYGETYVKITTFSQFLKLFKIALFSNKERDFKALNNEPDEKQIGTSLIMNIVTKVYSINVGEPPKTQKTTLIDLAENCGSTLSNAAVGEGTSQRGGLWDYFLIELNNMTGRKRQHYHLVEQNPLLSIMKHNLKNSKNFILASMSANPRRFHENYKWISELSELVDGVIPVVLQKNSHSLHQSAANLSANQQPKNQSLAQEKADMRRISNTSVMNNLLQPKETKKLFTQLFNKSFGSSTSFLIKSSKACGSHTSFLEQMQWYLNSLSQQICQTKYPSMREYRELKGKCTLFIDDSLSQILKFKKLYGRECDLKRRIRTTENILICDELSLIGGCVKSEHFKDFYNAKSYISLEREVLIKTQPVKQSLLELHKQREEIDKKFLEFKNRSLENLSLIHRPDKKDAVSQNKSSINAPFAAEINQFLLKMKNISRKILDHLVNSFSQIFLVDQRTLADEILWEEKVVEEVLMLSKELAKFKLDIDEATNKNMCNFENSDAMTTDAHLKIFVREIRDLVRDENHKKNYSRHPPSLLKIKEKLQHQNRFKQNNYRGETQPKGKQNSADKALAPALRSSVKAKSNGGKFSRLPLLLEKPANTFVISGQLSLGDMLMNPFENK